MAAEIFCAAVDHEVGAERERLLEMRRQKGIVDDEYGMLCMGQSRQGADITDFHHGIGRRLDENAASFGADMLPDQLQFRGINVFKSNAVAAVDLIAEARGPAVEIFGEQHVIAGDKELQQGTNGSHAGGKGPTSAATVQQRQRLFKLLAGRVQDAAVIVAGALLEAGMTESGRLIDRLADGAGPFLISLMSMYL